MDELQLCAKKRRKFWNELNLHIPYVCIKLHLSLKISKKIFTQINCLHEHLSLIKFGNFDVCWCGHFLSNSVENSTKHFLLHLRLFFLQQSFVLKFTEIFSKSYISFEKKTCDIFMLKNFVFDPLSILQFSQFVKESYVHKKFILPKNSTTLSSKSNFLVASSRPRRITSKYHWLTSWWLYCCWFKLRRAPVIFTPKLTDCCWEWD